MEKKLNVKELKLLLDYTNYIKECVSTKHEINKNAIRKYSKDSHWYKRIKQ